MYIFHDFFLGKCTRSDYTSCLFSSLAFWASACISFRKLFSLINAAKFSHRGSQTPVCSSARYPNPGDNQEHAAGCYVTFFSPPVNSYSQTNVNTHSPYRLTLCNCSYPPDKALLSLGKGDENKNAKRLDFNINTYKVPMLFNTSQASKHSHIIDLTTYDEEAGDFTFPFYRSGKLRLRELTWLAKKLYSS